MNAPVPAINPSRSYSAGATGTLPNDLQKSIPLLYMGPFYGNGDAHLLCLTPERFSDTFAAGSSRCRHLSPQWELLKEPDLERLRSSRMSDPVPVINRQWSENKMKRIGVIGLALVAISVMGGMSASSALANCELSLGYCILGVPLLAGETREIDASAGKEFVLRGEALFVKSVTKCPTLKLNAAQKPVIKGGMPGTGEKQLVEFEGCKATLGGTACTSVEVQNAATLTEQVMVLKPAGGKLATFFKPTNGTNFTTIKLNSCGGFGSQTATVTGTTAAYDEPLLTEKVTGLLLYLVGTEEIKEVEKSGGAKQVVGLEFGGNPATLEGTAEVLLVSKEPWGVF
jgi:hypothetical protein